MEAEFPLIMPKIFGTILHNKNIKVQETGIDLYVKADYEKHIKGKFLCKI